MTRILIVDDHPIVREGLKQIIAKSADMIVGGEAVSGQEALNKLRSEHWDVVLLDITLPDRSGLEVLRQIKGEGIKVRVLVLSMLPEEQYAVRMLKAGASGYMTKESAPEELINAIRKISLGGKYISLPLAERLAFNLDDDSERPPHEALSDREYEVLCMIAAGKTVRLISEELLLSPKTISGYRARALAKMKLKNNAEITRYAIRNKLVD
jgi:DNA-binding NarL/FixJ family response regulator